MIGESEVGVGEGTGGAGAGVDVKSESRLEQTGVQKVILPQYPVNQWIVVGEPVVS